MATCAFCSKRKGKRSCPALGGSICSACCGEHRLTKIDCPSNCVHLGGLAVMRETSATFTKDDYNTAVAKLFEFSRKAPPTHAISELFDGIAEEWEQPIITAFVLYGDRGPDGKRLVDRFLSSQGRIMTVGHVAALRALQGARASLFEVEGVQLGSGLDVRDMVSGERVHVREVSGTAQMKKWDLLLAWIMDCDDHVELTGASCLVPRDHLERVRAAIDRELVHARVRFPGVADRDLVGAIAWAPLMALRDAVRNAPMPELRTTTGEEIVVCKAHYSMRDRSAVETRLAALSPLETDDEGYVWTDRDHPERIVLGRISIDGEGLVLETMSKERNQRGKQMLSSALGELIAHRADSIQDMQAAMEAQRARVAGAADDIPDEVQREIVGDYLRDYYRGWLDEPVPALGNKSPRKAVRTKRGRVQVAALLKEIENGTLRQVGGDSVDFAELRRELGLVDEPVNSGDYDAERAPDPVKWLATDEMERTLAIEKYHRALASHPETPNPRLHATMHVVVENQLAAGAPSCAVETLERLVAAGLTRHEAVHAIASVVAEALFDVLKRNSVIDHEAVERALRRLRPEGWQFG